MRESLREMAIRMWRSGWLPKTPFLGLGAAPQPYSPRRTYTGTLLEPVREPTDVFTGRELPPESN